MGKRESPILKLAKLTDQVVMACSQCHLVIVDYQNMVQLRELECSVQITHHYISKFFPGEAILLTAHSVQFLRLEKSNEATVYYPAALPVKDVQCICCVGPQELICGEISGRILHFASSKKLLSESVRPHPSHPFRCSSRTFHFFTLGGLYSSSNSSFGQLLTQALEKRAALVHTPSPFR